MDWQVLRLGRFKISVFIVHRVSKVKGCFHARVAVEWAPLPRHVGRLEASVCASGNLPPAIWEASVEFPVSLASSTRCRPRGIMTSSYFCSTHWRSPLASIPLSKPSPRLHASKRALLAPMPRNGTYIVGTRVSQLLFCHVDSEDLPSNAQRRRPK